MRKSESEMHIVKDCYDYYIIINYRLSNGRHAKKKV
ncbi:MAG: hypothetical protein ACI8RD_001532 [Bacillariaceae sp.]|jgi:hypothetical protein